MRGDGEPLTSPHRELIVDTSAIPVPSMETHINHLLEDIVRADVGIEDATKIQAQWRISQCGSCTLMRMQIDGDSPSSLRRTADHLASEPDLYCHLFHVRRGAIVLQQNNSAVTINENQFAAIATNEPFETHRLGGFVDLHSVRLPLRLLSNRFQSPDAFPLRVFTIRPGIEAISMQFMETLVERMQGTPAEMWPVLTNQLADLVSLALLGVNALPSGESAVRSATLDRLKSFINERHFELNLTPGVIAAANGLSLRYLHRLFQESGQSVGDYIRTQRLAAARRSLENPLHRETSIADIGRAHGFRSAAHFSSAYCGEFGESPRTTRARLRDTLGASQWRRRLS